MDEKLMSLQLGALLHDIGKIVRRAGVDSQNHSEAGLNYLKQNNLLDSKYEEVYDMIRYHHARALKSSNLKEDSLAYIVYEADNVASGIDRRKYEDKTQLGNELAPLHSIFNVLYEEKNNIKKSFRMVDFDKGSFNIPTINNQILEAERYRKVLMYIEDNLKTFKNTLSPEKLLTILEACCSYIPSSSYVDYPNISYYDHVKLTAAISTCFYLYDKENGIQNFKEEYFSRPDRNQEKFLFVSGEFSGIQNFIYTISSKMAMKSLRGRSFYLELFTEHIIDEILLSLGLSRMNLLYSGGSHFYLLLPNTKHSREVLLRYKEKINDFLLRETGTTIYFEIAYTETSVEELGNDLSKEEKIQNRIGELFRRTSQEISKGKLRRYSLAQLNELFDENSTVNKIHSFTKECVICKKAESEKVLEKNAVELGGEIELCNACKGYINLGKDISKLYHSSTAMFFVEKNGNTDREYLTFPKYLDGDVSIVTAREEEIASVLKEGGNNIHRYYAVNSDYVGDKLCKNIFIGNYNKKNTKDKSSLIEFADLVKKSKGISRLAVLRADVDNLGMIFQSGFEAKNSKEAYKNVTLSKSVVLSRYLSDFFKRKINFLLEKKEIDGEKNIFFKQYCDIIHENNPLPREIVIVYSGGDDLFAIGTWNDIIEFSVDLRMAFKEFTNDKITLSAGIAFFSADFPIYQMADRAGNLEKMAKSHSVDNSTKDAVALFGEIGEQLNHVYTWDHFIENVLSEKYQFIKSIVVFDEADKKDDKEKIFLGKSRWYALMNLIRNRLVKTNKLDIARFAYILARIEHSKENKENYQIFKEKVFSWMKKEQDARELLTAIQLLIYQERGGQEND